MLTQTVETQFGLLSIVADDQHILQVRWGGAMREDASPLLDLAVTQMAAYDAGDLEDFDLPLSVKGSDLTVSVCAEMQKIPFGDTVTYGDIARVLNVPAQAVGQACGSNPIPIIIPCHRVMGAKGLTGFSGAGGVETKVALLRHEKAGGFLI